MQIIIMETKSMLLYALSLLEASVIGSDKPAVCGKVRACYLLRC